MNGIEVMFRELFSNPYRPYVREEPTRLVCRRGDYGGFTWLLYAGEERIGWIIEPRGGR